MRGWDHNYVANALQYSLSCGLSIFNHNSDRNGAEKFQSLQILPSNTLVMDRYVAGVIDISYFIVSYRHDQYLQGAPIKNNPLEKNSISTEL